MKKEHKVGFVDSLCKKIGVAEAKFLVEFNGLAVSEVNALRSKLRKNGAKVQVGKARLIKIAATDAGCDKNFVSSIRGQVALVLSSSDSSVVAKSLTEFKDEMKDKFALVSGIYLGQSFDSAGLTALGKLPSREVLVTQLAYGLNELIARLARVLSEVEKKNS